MPMDLQAIRSPGTSDIGLKLSRSRVIATLAIALWTAALCSPGLGDASISTTDSASAAPPSSVLPDWAAAFPSGQTQPRNSFAIETTTGPEAMESIGGLPTSPSATGWFDPSSFDPSVSDDRKVTLDPRGCVYPDSFLRNLAGVDDDCGIVRPSIAESEFLSLPFLALSGWAIIILVAAGLPHLYGKWRVKRWLSRVRPQGTMSRGANPRGAGRASVTSRSGHRPHSRHSPADANFARDQARPAFWTNARVPGAVPHSGRSDSRSATEQKR
jgi:hypothetical protein